jgi:hypothetical protein
MKCSKSSRAGKVREEEAGQHPPQESPKLQKVKNELAKTTGCTNLQALAAMRLARRRRQFSLRKLRRLS